MKVADAQTSELKEEIALTQLKALLQSLHSALPCLTPRDTRRILREPAALRGGCERGAEVMRDVFGFSLELKRSDLSGGGRGVFVREGKVAEGQLVGLYPGRGCWLHLKWT